VNGNSNVLFWFMPIALLSGAALVALVWLFIRRRRSVAEASCGKCGYFVVGLSGFICPECGSNLAEVGIHLPGDAAPMPQLCRALIYTLVFGSMSWLIAPMIEPLLPRCYSGSRSLQMSDPVSRQFRSVTATASGDGWSEEVTFDHVELTLVSSLGESQTLFVDVSSTASPITVVSVKQKDPSIQVSDIRQLRPELLLAWMLMSAGPDSPRLRDEAASVSAETIKLASSDQIQHITPLHTPFSSLNFRQSPPVGRLSKRVVIPALMFVVAIWFGGLVVVLRWNRPLRREVSYA
jgi:hypothetical protein